MILANYNLYRAFCWVARDDQGQQLILEETIDPKEWEDSLNKLAYAYTD